MEEAINLPRRRVIGTVGENMLLPKITLRHIMIAVTVLAFYCAAIASAARGNVVAYSMSLSIALLLIPFAFYGIVYWTLFGFARLGRSVFGNRSQPVPATSAEEVNE